MRYRSRLPQLTDERPFLTDGGLETTLIFHRGFDLPCFAAFVLLRDDAGAPGAARVLPLLPADRARPRPGFRGRRAAQSGLARHVVGGLRVNASTKSHAELDEAEELDEGDPVGLGADHRGLRPHLRGVRVLGGCCGTDARHVREICGAWLSR